MGQGDISQCPIFLSGEWDIQETSFCSFYFAGNCVEFPVRSVSGVCAAPENMTDTDHSVFFPGGKYHADFKETGF